MNKLTKLPKLLFIFLKIFMTFSCSKQDIGDLTSLMMIKYGPFFFNETLGRELIHITEYK